MKINLLLAAVTLGLITSCEPQSEKVDKENQKESEAFAKFILTDEESANQNFNKGFLSDSVNLENYNDNQLNTCDCNGILSIVYQNLSFKSDKEYVEKLYYLYQATSQQDLEQRRKSSVGIKVPDFGTGSWSSNKEKVQSIYNKYKLQVNYSLNYNEIIELNETYSRSEDVEKITSAWSSCIRECNDVPYLVYSESSDSTIIVSFDMKSNDFRGRRDKVKVTDIVFSDNLKFISANFKKEDKIRYSGTYNLKFKRKDKNKGYVRVDLAEGKIIPVDIKSIKKGPRIETRIIKESYQYKFAINVSKNWMTFTSPSGEVQKITFKNQDRSHYKLSFNVKTILKNPDAIIYDYYYSPITGGLGDFQKKGIKIEPDGTLSLDCYMVTGKKKMTGTFNIFYGISKDICVENCDE